MTLSFPCVTVEELYQTLIKTHEAMHNLNVFSSKCYYESFFCQALYANPHEKVEMNPCLTKNLPWSGGTKYFPYPSQIYCIIKYCAITLSFPDIANSMGSVKLSDNKENNPTNFNQFARQMTGRSAKDAQNSGLKHQPAVEPLMPFQQNRIVR